MPYGYSSPCRGAVSMDISLKDVDINQCDSQSSGVKNSKETGNKQEALNTFLGTHRCKPSTVVSEDLVQIIKSPYYLAGCARAQDEAYDWLPTLLSSWNYFDPRDCPFVTRAPSIPVSSKQ